jgi:NAD(P)-dependent dehydrogenase (short-subunit alcohol dehydrogenase family)
VARAHAFSIDDIGDLTGRTALVTGANSGIGLPTALTLAAKGAHVIVACRTIEKATRTVDLFYGSLPTVSAEPLGIDLADLYSVRTAAGAVLTAHERLDLVVNNAGVMGTPYRLTPDGYELQLATNHLGPFALTGLLLDRLLTTQGSRVVTVSSGLHRLAHLPLDDPSSARHYNPWTAYGGSKLANLLFTAELARRLAEAGAPTRAVAAHPGWARTNLAANGPTMSAGRLRTRAARLAARSFGRSAEAGALPTLYAATAPAVRNGAYVGPTGPFEMIGATGTVKTSRRARHADLARRLFEISETLTGVAYDLGPADTTTPHSPPAGADSHKR